MFQISEKAENALANEDSEEVLLVVEDLVAATSLEDTPQLPQDLDTTNDIITGALDLLIEELEEGRDVSNATEVSIVKNILFKLCNWILCFLVYCHI